MALLLNQFRRTLSQYSDILVRMTMHGICIGLGKSWIFRADFEYFNFYMVWLLALCLEEMFLNIEVQLLCSM